jgi:imidazolonepropionase-like amidohydrolase
MGLVFVLCPMVARSQEQSESLLPTSISILVKVGKLLDVRRGNYIENAGIWIEGERIREVGPADDVELHIPKTTQVIELGHMTVLPGLIDCHTHLMARIPDTPDGYTLNLATKSEAFRALEGAFDARITLNAGFTTVRDVATRGLRLRDSTNRSVYRPT